MTPSEERRPHWGALIRLGFSRAKPTKTSPLDDDEWRQTRKRIQALERAALRRLPEEQAAELRTRFGAGSTDDDDAS